MNQDLSQFVPRLDSRQLAGEVAGKRSPKIDALVMFRMLRERGVSSMEIAQEITKAGNRTTRQNVNDRYLFAFKTRK